MAICMGKASAAALWSYTLQWFSAKGNHTWDISVWEVCFGCVVIKGCECNLVISVYHLVFQKNRAWMNRGVCVIAGKSSRWPSVSVGLCKQPCVVLPHLTQEVTLPREEDTLTLNGRKLEMVYESYLALLLNERSCGLARLTHLLWLSL